MEILRPNGALFFLSKSPRVEASNPHTNQGGFYEGEPYTLWPSGK
jgi:hypothetical protein